MFRAGNQIEAWLKSEFCAFKFWSTDGDPIETHAFTKMHFSIHFSSI